MPTPEIHAKLSASSAHRWLHCPPSVKLAEQFPATTSSYAEAGRLAHSIAELKARKYFLEPMPTRTYNTALKKLKADEHYEPRMDETTDIYLETLKGLAMEFDAPPFVALETRVDFSRYVPEGFGTADCIMIGGEWIVVIDYKNGAGEPVEAEENPQMSLYALGALQVYEPIFGDTIKNVSLVIVQPNAGGVKTWDTTVEALRQWAVDVAAPTAALAWMGEGDFCAGSWCRFCPAKAQCSARAAKMLELEPQLGAKPKAQGGILTDEEIGPILTKAKHLAAWVKDLEAYALSATLDGKTIPGWKAVEGRGSRDWANQDEAFEALKAKGVDEALLYERKPVSVAALEKALGKKVFGETTEGLVVKNPGKPTLVPASDKRPAYNAAAAASGGRAMAETCIIKVRPPSGFIQADVLEAARSMKVPEMKKLFKGLGQWISDEDCQRAMDALAKLIRESRAEAADKILMGQWPVTPPVSVNTLRYFVNAQLPIVLSVCTIPEIYFELEKE